MTERSFDSRSFDPFWEEKYASGHTQRYPWDAVVSFVFRHAPRDRPRSEVRILEVGCGTASNLWFAAREGFSVAGVEGSESAVDAARKRFAEEGLHADLRVGDFTSLAFADRQFDLVIDRGALTCCGYGDARRAVGEVRRVLREGGKFFFNPYSKRHSSAASGRSGADGLRLDISAGTLVGAGQLCFYGPEDVDRALGAGWEVLSRQHGEWVELAATPALSHAEWRIIVQRRDEPA
jgi:SAM-dependent methyltransferase